MKDKTARALAIVALVFMVIFLVAMTAALIDYRLLNGSIGFIALGTGVFVLMIFIALKADGRGYSITKMNNEMEMERIRKEIEEAAGDAADGESDAAAQEPEGESDGQAE